MCAKLHIYVHYRYKLTTAPVAYEVLDVQSPTKLVVSLNAVQLSISSAKY